MHSFCWQVLELEFNYANNFSHSPSDCIKCISTLIFQSFLIDNKLCAEELGTLATHSWVSFAPWLCHWFSTRLLLCWLRINIRAFQWIFQMSGAVKLIPGILFLWINLNNFIYIDPVGMFGGHLNIWFISRPASQAKCYWFQSSTFLDKFAQDKLALLWYQYSSRIWQRSCWLWLQFENPIKLQQLVLLRKVILAITVQGKK